MLSSPKPQAVTALNLEDTEPKTYPHILNQKPSLKDRGPSKSMIDRVLSAIVRVLIGADTIFLVILKPL